MIEAFVQFIWQYQYFNKENLNLHETSEPLIVLKPGRKNNHAGPDFLNATIQIGALTFHGHVEIHTKASDWLEHKHSTDALYQNVILHVVWENDVAIQYSGNEKIPTLILNNRVDESVYEKFLLLQANPQETLPCQPFWNDVMNLHKLSMLERSLVERIQRKAENVLEIYKSTKGDWLETFYKLMLQSIGTKLNESGFGQLASAVSFRLLSRHLSKPLQVEALLFGYSGLLSRLHLDAKTNDVLKKEYTFLAGKYNFSGEEPIWRYAKTRPGNFPDVRLAQICRVVTKLDVLYSQALDQTPAKDWMQTLKQAFEHDADFLVRIKPPGSFFYQTLAINTLVEFRAARALHHQNTADFEAVLVELEKLKPETNHVIRYWEALNWKPKSAFDSQAMLEWYRNYCNPKQCLQCAVGVAIMKPAH